MEKAKFILDLWVDYWWTGPLGVVLSAMFASANGKYHVDKPESKKLIIFGILSLIFPPIGWFMALKELRIYR